MHPSASQHKRCIFINNGVGFMLSFNSERPLFKKEGLPSLFGVAFQQGSVHCITKLLRGFQNIVSKAF